jgi:hypothetical protein
LAIEVVLPTPFTPFDQENGRPFRDELDIIDDRFSAFDIADEHLIDQEFIDLVGILDSLGFDLLRRLSTSLRVKATPTSASMRICSSSSK